MTDLTLFDNVRITDPDTSRDAARSLDRNADCMAVLAALCFLQHANAYELTVRLNRGERVWAQNCVARRLTDLRDNGLIRDSGDRRPGSSNRAQIVYAPTDRGARTAQNERAGL